ncbi:MAG: hypothetical protein JO180_09975 [Gemmatirosa sp.]|nr:hypothetical protein [Gemmatirosa sp.]
MLDDADIPVLLTLVVACAIWTRPAVMDIVGFAAVSAAVGSCVRVATAGFGATLDLVRDLVRGLRD